MECISELSDSLNVYFGCISPENFIPIRLNSYTIQLLLFFYQDMIKLIFKYTN